MSIDDSGLEFYYVAVHHLLVEEARKLDPEIVNLEAAKFDQVVARVTPLDMHVALRLEKLRRTRFTAAVKNAIDNTDWYIRSYLSINVNIWDNKVRPSYEQLKRLV